jgi:hypothetical protein
MRVWRALKDAGCAVLRDGVYLLPAQSGDGASLERLEKEIRTHGGFALRLQSTPKAPSEQSRLRALFDRTPQYAGLIEEIGTAKASLPRLGPRRGRTAVQRIERAVQKLARIDFFPGEAKEQATAAIADLKARYAELHSPNEPRASMRGLRRANPADYQKRIWATRKSPWVDRLASAWLIKRFIDRDARFVWLERPSALPRKAVGFDFDGAEFTHVKNRVTFEVLVATFALENDAALQSIAKAVHFLDVGGIPVADARVVEAMLKGAREKAKSDDGLLAEAMRTLDLLYSGYKSAAS